MGDWPESYKYDHTTDSNPSQVIAVADMDFYTPQLSMRGKGQTPSNDNLNLLFNMVRDLMEEPEALKIRLRHEANRRPFTVIDAHLTDVAAKFSADEQALVSELMNIRRKLADKRHERNMKRFEDIRLEQQIDELDFKELQKLHEIDAARQKAFETAKTYMSMLTAAIVFGAGATLLVFGMLYKLMRRRRVRRKLLKYRRSIKPLEHYRLKAQGRLFLPCVFL